MCSIAYDVVKVHHIFVDNDYIHLEYTNILCMSLKCNIPIAFYKIYSITPSNVDYLLDKVVLVISTVFPENIYYFRTKGLPTE